MGSPQTPLRVSSFNHRLVGPMAGDTLHGTVRGGQAGGDGLEAVYLTEAAGQQLAGVFS